MDNILKCKTTKCFKDNIGENLDNLTYGNEMLDISKSRSMKEINDKTEFIKVKKKTAF